MPLDPEVVAETKSWLEKAFSDLRTAKHSLTSKPPLTDASVFHSQQAAEKALKAFLTFHQKSFRKTHNLEELGRQCVKFDPLLEQSVNQAVPLTEYAWRYRYPGEPEDASIDEAQKAIDIAETLYKTVIKELEF